MGQFQAGEWVSFAAARSRPYPTWKGRKGKRLYLLVAQMAIEKRFQGVVDPAGRATYAKEIFDELRRIAASEGCVGLYLNVRRENARARRCYESVGFKGDGEYPSPHIPGAQMVRYRLDF